MSKPFLAVGDLLINPALLTYAISEGTQLRLGFASHGSAAPGELRLSGDVAKEVLRWLRLNAEFLTANGRFGAHGIASANSRGGEPDGLTPSGGTTTVLKLGLGSNLAASSGSPRRRVLEDV